MSAGLLGVGLRYWFIVMFSSSHFAIPTLIVNTLGCFIFGLVIAFSDQIQVSEIIKLSLLVGLCGALTTFSSFAYDLIRLISHEKFSYACIYFLSTNILSIIGFSLGYFLPNSIKF